MRLTWGRSAMDDRLNSDWSHCEVIWSLLGDMSRKWAICLRQTDRVTLWAPVGAEKVVLDLWVSWVLYSTFGLGAWVLFGFEKRILGDKNLLLVREWSDKIDKPNLTVVARARRTFPFFMRKWKQRWRITSRSRFFFLLWLPSSELPGNKFTEDWTSKYRWS